MYISRALLLIVVLMLVFTPLFQEWVSAQDSFWFKPWISWLALIVVVMLVNHFSYRDDN